MLFGEVVLPPYSLVLTGCPMFVATRTDWSSAESCDVLGGFDLG
jgi:hypothetical protein